MLISIRSSSTVLRCKGEPINPNKPAVAEKAPIFMSGGTSVRPLCRRLRPSPLTSGRENTETWSEARSTSLLKRLFSASTASSRTWGVSRVAIESRTTSVMTRRVQATSTPRRPCLRVNLPNELSRPVSIAIGQVYSQFMPELNPDRFSGEVGRCNGLSCRPRRRCGSPEGAKWTSDCQLQRTRDCGF